MYLIMLWSSKPYTKEEQAGMQIMTKSFLWNQNHGQKWHLVVYFIFLFLVVCVLCVCVSVHVHEWVFVYVGKPIKEMHISIQRNTP